MLERATGSIEAEVAINGATQAAFGGLLQSIVETTDFGNVQGNAFVVDDSAFNFDHSADPNNQNQDKPTAKIEGTLSSDGDSDWFQVNLTNGQQFFADIDGGFDMGVSVDIELKVFTVFNGNLINFVSSFDTTTTDTGSVSTFDPRLTFTAFQTGTYFIKLDDSRPGGPGSAGDYTLYLSKSTDVQASAQQTVQVTGDTDGDGVADPGETVTVTTVIDNAGTEDARNVVLNQTLQGMTFVDGTINVSPLAFDDTYQAIGNIGLTVDAAAGVRANDLEFTGTGFDPLFDAIADTTITVATGPTNGALTLNADGSFVYNPDVGFSGTDTFTYTITDDAGLSTTGTVTVEVQNVIWVIDDTTAGGANLGTLADPFRSLGAYNAAVAAGGANAPGAGDIIFLDAGDDGTYDGGIVLRSLA